MANCHVCGSEKKEEELIKVLDYYVCADCLEKYLKSDEYFFEKIIYNIWDLYPDEPPNIFTIKAQLRTLRSQYGFTYKGILYALKYWLQFHEWNPDYLLYQAFPKAYYEANRYYKKRKKLEKSVKETDIEQVPEQVRGDNRKYKQPLKLDD